MIHDHALVIHYDKEDYYVCRTQQHHHRLDGVTIYTAYEQANQHK